jgi:hypothetical protein
MMFGDVNSVGTERFDNLGSFFLGHERKPFLRAQPRIIIQYDQ